MKAILIGGTPGTGKTLVASGLAQQLKMGVISLGDLATQGGCIQSHDESRDTEVIDEDCLVEAVIDFVDETDSDMVVEGHYIDLFPSRHVQHVFVLRTHPEELMKRLRDRGYSEDKVKENVEAEVIGVCQLDALDAFGEGMVTEIDTTGKDVRSVVAEIVGQLGDPDTTVRIDWMQQLEDEGRLDQFLD